MFDVPTWLKALGFVLGVWAGIIVIAAVILLLFALNPAIPAVILVLCVLCISVLMIMEEFEQ